MALFAHILNFVSEAENPSLHDVQKLTLASLQKAKSYTGDKTNVELLVCAYKKYPVESVPGFRILPPLERSVLDLHTFHESRALPLLKDILELACRNTNAEYIVYSNADIGVMPQFYNALEEYMKQQDALVINRRRIKSTLNKVGDLDKIYSETGLPHIGYDMFVFRRELFSKFILHDTCLGIPFVGNDLFYNLFCFAERPHLMTDKHLTFHIGLELRKAWGSAELEQHNYREFRKTTRALLPYMDIAKFPGASLNFFKRHFKWLMNPTLSYPEMCITDLKQIGKKRTREIYDPNYKKQSYAEWLIRRINFD
jgi:hypothetical protein